MSSENVRLWLIIWFRYEENLRNSKFILFLRYLYDWTVLAFTVHKLTIIYIVMIIFHSYFIRVVRMDCFNIGKYIEVNYLQSIERKKNRNTIWGFLFSRFIPEKFVSRWFSFWIRQLRVNKRTESDFQRGIHVGWKR